jgi:Acetoacetate decarboxylase (ADC)
VIDYAAYGGEYLPRQPYKSEGILAYLFAVGADIDWLQTLVDRTLNKVATRTTYFVAAPAVLISFMKMDRLTSLHPDDRDKGIWRENELNFTIPLLVCKNGIPCRLAVWMPYLWVDSSTVMIAGREVFGFPKQMGVFKMPDANGQAADFSVEAEVITQFAPTARAAQKPILRATRLDAPGIIAPDTAFTQLEDCLKHAAGSIGLVHSAESFVDSLIHDGSYFVFLKQFRDITDGSLACYRGVFETRAPIPRFGRAELLAGKYELQISDHDSAPLARELFCGTPRQVFTATPIFSMRLDFDFILECGQGPM